MSDRLYHVSLRSPMTVALMERREWIDGFDASIDPGTELGGMVTFQTVKLYRSARSSDAKTWPAGAAPATMRTSLSVPVANISGMQHIKPRN